MRASRAAAPRRAGRSGGSRRRNSTSPASRPVRIAAESPDRSIAGPGLGGYRRSGHPSSAATIMASDVFPRPRRAGTRDVILRARCRRCAPTAEKQSSCSRTRGWPMNSASCLGRRLASASPLRGNREAGDHLRFGHLRTQHPDRAAQRGPDTSGARRPPGVTASSAPSMSLPVKPRLTRAGPDLAPPRRLRPGGQPPAQPLTDPAPTAPIRSRSSTTSFSAPLRPIPGTRVRVARSSVDTARRTSSGLSTARIARPASGRRRSRSCSSSKRSRSSSSAKAVTASASPRGRSGWWPAGRGCRSAGWPAACGVHRDRRAPHAAHLDRTAWSTPDPGHPVPDTSEM